MRIYPHEVEGVKWAFVPIAEGSSYLVCIGTMNQVQEMSIQEIMDARQRAIEANKFENLVVPGQKH